MTTSSNTTTPPTTPTRRRRALAVGLVGLSALVPVALPAAAGAEDSRSAPPTTSEACKPFTHARERIATEIARRQATIVELVASLQAASDPYGVNGGQIAALQSSANGLTALGQQISTACYPDVASLRADAQKVLFEHRIYALRVPQSRVIEAADRLGTARNELQSVADTLATKVGDDAEARAELDAMNQALADADSVIGRPPTLTGAPADVVALEPAQDLDPTRAALTAARDAVKSAHQDLASARDHAKAAVAALRS